MREATPRFHPLSLFGCPSLGARCAALLTTACLVFALSGEARAVNYANVSVDASSVSATMSDYGLGIHTSPYYNEMGAADMDDRLEEAGVTTMRFGGGGYADVYHWSIARPQWGKRHHGWRPVSLVGGAGQLRVRRARQRLRQLRRAPGPHRQQPGGGDGQLRVGSEAGERPVGRPRLRRAAQGGRRLGRLRQLGRLDLRHAQRHRHRRRRAGQRLEDGRLLGTPPGLDDQPVPELGERRRGVRPSERPPGDRSGRAGRRRVLGDRQRDVRHGLLRRRDGLLRRLRRAVRRHEPAGPPRSVAHQVRPGSRSVLAADEVDRPDDQDRRRAQHPRRTTTRGGRVGTTTSCSRRPPTSTS